MLNLDSVPQRICFKTSAETFAQLVEKEGIVPAPYVGRYQWVLVEHLDVLREDELEDLIRQSCEMVAAKFPAPHVENPRNRVREGGRHEKLIGDSWKGDADLTLLSAWASLNDLPRACSGSLTAAAMLRGNRPIESSCDPKVSC